MTNEQILKKAIEKAVENGWDYKEKLHHLEPAFGEDKMVFVDGLTQKRFKFAVYTVIFSHDFAKAFFDEGKRRCGCGKYEVCGPSFHDPVPVKDWEYHLQQMVLKTDPIKYLEKFL